MAFVFGGGAGIGAALTGHVVQLRSCTADPVLQTVIAVVTMYGAYMTAETAETADTADTSGVTAMAVAGVAVGGARLKVTDARTRLQAHAVYAIVVFLLESVVFALIGLVLPTFVKDLPPGSRWWPVQAAILIAVRIARLWPTARVATTIRGYPAWPLTRVATRAGTRGVMPLAAALAIPLADSDGVPLPGRPLILVLTTTVVAVVLTVQG